MIFTLFASLGFCRCLVFQLLEVFSSSGFGHSLFYVANFDMSAISCKHFGYSVPFWKFESFGRPSESPVSWNTGDLEIVSYNNYLEHGLFSLGMYDLLEISAWNSLNLALDLIWEAIFMFGPDYSTLPHPSAMLFTYLLHIRCRPQMLIVRAIPCAFQTL